MNTNLQIKTFEDSLGLDFQDSKQIFNRNGSDTTSALISQRGISGKTNNSTKGNGLNKGCGQTKDTASRPVKEEINQLAKAWCELLLGQIQEVHNQPVPLKLKPLRI